MATTQKFKIGYVAKDGTNRTFTFKSDRRMIVYSPHRSGGGFSFGMTWKRDRDRAIAGLMNSDSTMKRCGGISRYRYAKNESTGECYETIYMM